MATIPRKTLGRYEILEQLGKGAMGVVYLARDPLIGRLVALKAFHAGYAMGDEDLEQFRLRFIREAQSAGILSHPNIVTIHDVVEESEEGVTFIAMEYVQGTTLKEILQRGEPLELEFVADVMDQVADALDYAHQKGVVHRDIKPANIILTADGRIKITDFGIARVNTSNLTLDGQLLGTPNYMAPEQILGEEVDHRADVFSLGIVLYEMLTRQKPFQGENLTVVSHRIVYEPFTPPREFVEELPPGLEDVLARALEKDPALRYQSAGELARELRQVVDRYLTQARLSETQEIPPFVLTEIQEGAEKGTAGPGVVTTERGAKPEAAALTKGASVPPAKEKVGRPGRLSPLLRRLLLGGGVAAASLLLGWLAVWWVASPATGPEPDLAAHRIRLRYVPHLLEGRRLLQAGDPAAAAAAFARAERLAPEGSGVRQLREEAERLAAAQWEEETRERRIFQALEEGRQALSQRRYGDAMAAFRAVLELEPEHAEATSLLRRAEVAARRQVARSRPAPSPQPPPAQPVEEPTTAEASPRTGGAQEEEEMGGEGTLRVHFFSHLPEGVLTVYVGDRQILRQPFRFYERTGFFRSEPRSGSLEASRHLPAGPVKLRVYMALKGEPAQLVRLEGRLPRGGERTLEILLAEDGKLSARLR